MSISGTFHPATGLDLPHQQASHLRVVLSLFVAMLVAAVLPLLGPLFLRDPDSWWHIKVGLDILKQGSVPTTDTYSHTFFGQPWIAKEWLAQVIFAMAYRAAGWNGIVLIVSSSMALTAFLTCWSLSRYLRPAFSAVITLALIILVAPIFTARPHILTLPLLVVWTSQLFQAARDKTVPPLWSLCIVWLWANLHATFTLAFVIAGFAGLDLLQRIRFSDPRLIARWLGFGALCICVSLLNPYGLKAILATFSVAYGNEAVALIKEWQPFNAATNKPQKFAILIGLFGLLVSGVRISWPRALLCIFALNLYLTHTRFVYLFFLVVPLISVEAFATRYQWIATDNWMRSPRDKFEQFISRNFPFAVSLLLFSIICASALTIRVQDNEPGPETSARDALAFVAENKISGRVLNSYNLGGTLIFHGIPTFIDGRTDQLFLGGFARIDEDTTLRTGKPLLENQIEKYQIDWALLTADDPRAQFLSEMPNWRRAYTDVYSVVFVRNAE